MIRGACEVLADRRSLDAEAFVAGLEGAKDRAYASVREPVEGTMLTVIKDAALAARQAVEGGDSDLPSVLRRRGRRPTIRCAAPRRCSQSCARPASSMLGGWVLPWSSTACTPALVGRRSRFPKRTRTTPDLEAIHAQEEAWGYCTEFLVDGFEATWRSSRSVYASGRSVLVVAQDDVVKVHVHAGPWRCPLLRGPLAGVKSMTWRPRSAREPEGMRPDWA